MEATHAVFFESAVPRALATAAVLILGDLQQS